MKSKNYILKSHTVNSSLALIQRVTRSELHQLSGAHPSWRDSGKILSKEIGSQTLGIARSSHSTRSYCSVSPIYICVFVTELVGRFLGKILNILGCPVRRIFTKKLYWEVTCSKVISHKAISWTLVKQSLECYVEDWKFYQQVKKT